MISALRLDSEWLTYLTYALSLQVDHKGHRPFCSIQFCPFAIASIFLQLYLNPAVPISDSRSLLQIFRGRPLLPWPCGFHCRACSAMLPSFLRNACPSQVHFLLLICISFWFLVGVSHCCWFCLASAVMLTRTGHARTRTRTKTKPKGPGQGQGQGLDLQGQGQGLKFGP